MKEISQLEILEGIAGALLSGFPNSHVYKHRVPQALEEGDFTVRQIVAMRPERFNERVMNLTSWEIVYYGRENPNDPDGLTDDLMKAELILKAVLHSITTPSGAVIHALNDISITPIEDRLHITVRYRCHVLELRLVQMVDDQGNPMYDEYGNPIEVDERQLQDAMMEILERGDCRKGEDDGS